MRKGRKIIVAAQCAAAMLLGGLYADHAFAQTSAIANGPWEDPNTWDNGLPAAGLQTNIGANFTVTSSGIGNQSGNVVISQDASLLGPGDPGPTLNVTGGTLSTLGGSNSGGTVIQIGAGVGQIGSFTMSGGTVNVGLDFPTAGQRFFLVGDFGSRGTANITGGTINAGRFIVGSNGNGGTSSFGTLNISNATVNTDDPNTGVDFGFLGAGANVTIGPGTIINTPGRYRTGVFQGTGSTVVVQNGGTITSSVVVLGGDRPSNYTLNAGSLIGTNDFVVGDFNYAGANTSNTPSFFTINGGVVSTTGRLGFGFTAAGAHGAGTQTAGTVTCGGFILGRANGVGTSGTYTMSGGTLTQTFTNGSNPDTDFVVGQGADSVGVFTHTGGAVSAQNVFLGDFDRANATYTISGGSLDVATDMFVGSALAANAPFAAFVNPTKITIPGGQAQGVVALFSVVGHGASSITVGRDFLANPADRSTNTTQVGPLNKATLEFDVADATGTTLIQVGNVADLDGAVIDIKPINGFTPTAHQTFNLFTAQSFMLTGTTFAAEDAGNYTYALIPGGNGQILQVTFLASNNLVFNQVGGTFDTNPANTPFTNTATNAPAAFTTGDTVNFTDAAVGPVNVAAAGVSPSATVVSNTSGTYTFNGGGILGGSLTKSNAGTLVLANAANTFSNVTVGGGTLAVGGTAGAAAPLTVTGTLSVTNGAAVVFSPSAGGAAGVITHRVNNLTLGATGSIDLSNTALVLNATNNSVVQVRSLLATAYANGTFTNTAGVINSSTVMADPAHKTIAYLSGANTNNAALSPALTNTAAVLLRPSLIGDFNIDGKVDRFDVRAFNARNAFNDGLTTHDFADGDLNFDGKVDRFDVRAFNAGNNFNSGVTFAAQAQTLTSAASPAAVSNTTTVGTAGDGKPDLVYNPATGGVVFKYDGYVVPAGFTILELDIGSTKGSLRPDGVNSAAAGSISKTAGDIDYQNLGNTPVADGADLGTIFPVGLTPQQLTTNDIAANFFLNGDANPTKFADVVSSAGVPEPASLSLVAVGAAGLLSRKRRARQEPS